MPPTVHIIGRNHWVPAGGYAAASGALLAATTPQETVTASHRKLQLQSEDSQLNENGLTRTQFKATVTLRSQNSTAVAAPAKPAQQRRFQRRQGPVGAKVYGVD